MTAPIVIYKPKLYFQAFNENDDPDGPPVNLTCDAAVAEIGVDTPITVVPTFCGKYKVPGDIEESFTLSAVVTPETDANWAALLGKRGEFHVYDRQDATQYRKFTSLITVNPSLYGATQPGEARQVNLEFPVLSEVEWETVPS